MGVTAAVTAEPAVYTFEGKDWKVCPWTVEIQAAFETYLENQAYKTYERLSAKLPPDEADRLLANLTRDIAAGAYTFGTETVHKALQSPVHVRYLFFLCVKKNHKEFTQDLAKRIADADYGGVIWAMNTANTDPNLRKPRGGETPGAEGEADPAPAPPTGGPSPAA